jgi:hypothetical protein
MTECKTAIISFVDKFSQSQDNANLVEQIRRLENPEFSRNQVGGQPGFIPDGRINPNLNRLGGESMNNLGGSFNPYSPPNQPYQPRDAYPNVLGHTKPAMETPLPPQANAMQTQGYNIHANSKFYYPKDAEFLSNDYMSKPGAKFNANKNAVLIKDERQNTIDPHLEELRKNLKRYESQGLNVPNTASNPHFTSMLPMGHQPFSGNSFPVTGHHQMSFAPQKGNTQMENNQNLMKNVQMLGGLPSAIDPMQQSLAENELRFMGRNTLDPRNAGLLNSNKADFNPYTQQEGILNAARVQAAMFGVAAAAGANDQLTALRQHEATQLDMGKRMRAEREQQMLELEKTNQKFGTFSKMLQGSLPSGGQAGSYTVQY